MFDDEFMNWMLLDPETWDMNKEEDTCEYNEVDEYDEVENDID